MQSYFDIEIVVVDYNCPQNTGEWVKAYYDDNIKHPVKVAFANVEPDEWSLSAARNFGFKNSTGEIVFFLDADALLTDINFIQKHVEHLVEGSFICGWGYGEATGCLMCHRVTFEAVRGYNELLKAWGYEDIDIYWRMENHFSIEKRVWLGGIETIKHGDEWRNFYHGQKPVFETNDQNAEIAKTQFKGL
jgi:glycosyltransferase involved in cell wall biosynthesis